MKKPIRTFLYRADHPKGKIFTSPPDDLNALAADGWVDSPAKIEGHGEASPARVPAPSGDSKVEDLVAAFQDGRKLNKAQLLQVAAHIGVEADEDMTNAKIAEAIEAKLTEPPALTPSA